MIRHATRHVQATILNVLREQLTILGWTDDAHLPFGNKHAAVVRFTDSPAIGEDRSFTEGVGAGTLACTLGDEAPPSPEEIGGPLTRQDYPVFLDILQPSYAAATALANDVRDILVGRMPGTRRHIRVINQVTGEPVPGWICELTDVEITRPEVRMPLHWQVVKVTAEVYFSEVQW